MGISGIDDLDPSVRTCRSISFHSVSSSSETPSEDDLFIVESKLNVQPQRSLINSNQSPKREHMNRPSIGSVMKSKVKPLTISPPVQKMEKPSPKFDPNRIPKSVFMSQAPGPTDWSVASNESLFSIRIGSNSFPKENVQSVPEEMGQMEENEISDKAREPMIDSDPPEAGEVESVEEFVEAESELSQTDEAPLHELSFKHHTNVKGVHKKQEINVVSFLVATIAVVSNLGRRLAVEIVVVKNAVCGLVATIVAALNVVSGRAVMVVATARVAASGLVAEIAVVPNVVRGLAATIVAVSNAVSCLLVSAVVVARIVASGQAVMVVVVARIVANGQAANLVNGRHVAVVLSVVRGRVVAAKVVVNGRVASAHSSTASPAVAAVVEKAFLALVQRIVVSGRAVASHGGVSFVVSLNYSILAEDLRERVAERDNPHTNTQARWQARRIVAQNKILHNS